MLDISSSTKLDAAIIDIFSKLGITIIDIYGATEISGVISKNSLNRSKRGSCGKLIPGLEAKLENLEKIPGIPSLCGELYIKGNGVAKGYKGESNFLVDADGFYNTGDIAYLDDEQWVYIVGRKKELIKWSDTSYSDLMHLFNRIAMASLNQIDRTSRLDKCIKSLYDVSDHLMSSFFRPTM